LTPEFGLVWFGLVWFGLVCKLLIPKATRGVEPISCRGALLSTLLHATAYMFLHNLLHVLVQITNKIGLQKKSCNVEHYFRSTMYHDMFLSGS
jgi:hypothetical protein